MNTNRPPRSQLSRMITLGVVLGTLTGLFATNQGTAVHGTAIYAAAGYGITVALMAKAAGLPALGTVVRSLLLITGTILAVLGAGVLRTATTR